MLFFDEIHALFGDGGDERAEGGERHWSVRYMPGRALPDKAARRDDAALRLDASETAVNALLDAGGFDPELGARPMRRAIARLIEAPIADMILKGELSRGDVATVDVEDGKIVVDAITPKRAAGERAILGRGSVASRRAQPALGTWR